MKFMDTVGFVDLANTVDHSTTLRAGEACKGGKLRRQATEAMRKGSGSLNSKRSTLN